MASVPGVAKAPGQEHSVSSAALSQEPQKYPSVLRNTAEAQTAPDIDTLNQTNSSILRKCLILTKGWVNSLLPAVLWLLD